MIWPRCIYPRIPREGLRKTIEYPISTQWWEVFPVSENVTGEIKFARTAIVLGTVAQLHTIVAHQDWGLKLHDQ